MVHSSYGDVFHSDPELELLDGRRSTTASSDDPARALKTAPIITGDAFLASSPQTFPQRAVYGQIISQECPGFPAQIESEKLYINSNAPFSAVVCGVQAFQGSGKSHSTSVLLESCLIPDSRLGTLPEPLSAIVFHFDTAAGSGAVHPCEAAYVGKLDQRRGGHAVPPRVTVLVLPSTLKTMRQVYGQLGTHIRVEPLRFAPEDISGERLLSMMKVDTDTQMPLYMEAIMDILRSMEDVFDYKAFRDELKTRSKDFNPNQKSMLGLRLSLLDSCLEGGNRTNRATSFFRRGHLTIIDLSSVFMDSSSACGLFEIILGLFIEARTDATGKLVVLDEAHKYLTNNGSSARLTDSLLSVIRQQRHLGTRVVISTQEPTVVPPQFLDLCSFVIAHRFSSPMWLKHLEQHVSTVNSNWLSKVVSLRTGEALIFAPSGVGLTSKTEDVDVDEDAEVILVQHSKGKESPVSRAAVAPLGQGYLHVRSRLRITHDGGMSIMSSDDTLRHSPAEAQMRRSSSPESSLGESDYMSRLMKDGRVGPSGLLTPTTPPPVVLPSAGVSQELTFRSSPSSAPPARHAPTMCTVNPTASSNPPTINGIEDLRRLLVKLCQEGTTQPSFSDIGVARSIAQPPWTYTGKIRHLVMQAIDEGMVSLVNGDCVSLRSPSPTSVGILQNSTTSTPVVVDEAAITQLRRVLIQLYQDGNKAPSLALLDTRRRQAHWSYSGDIKPLVQAAALRKIATVVGTAVQLRIPPEHQVLMDVLSGEFAKTSEPFVAFTALGALLLAKKSGCYSGKLKDYIQNAVDIQLVRTRGQASTLAVGLAV